MIFLLKGLTKKNKKKKLVIININIYYEVLYLIIDN